MTDRPGSHGKAHGAALLCMALAHSACWSSRTVASQELLPLRKGGADPHAATELSSAGRKIRIDPNAVLRLRTRDGQISVPKTGRQLRVSPHGVHIREALPLAQAIEARVTGLAPEAIAALQATRPGGARLRRDGAQQWLMSAESPLLESWVVDFVDAIARQSAPPEPERWCYYPHIIHTKRLWPGTEPSESCLAEVTWPVAYLRYQLGSQALGSWSFAFAPGHWSREIERDELFRALDEGAMMEVGWPWQEIEGVEVTSLSGIKTLGLIAVYSAALAARIIDEFEVGGPQVEVPDDPWQPRLLGGRQGESVPMFRRESRRRSTLQAYATASATASEFSRRNYTLDLNVGLRIFDALELGLGIGHLTTEMGAHGRYYTARLGGHLPIDAEHRFSIPISLDFGGSKRIEGIARLNLGLRAALGEKIFVGASVSPTAMQLTMPSGDFENRVLLGYSLELGFSI